MHGPHAFGRSFWMGSMTYRTFAYGDNELDNLPDTDASQFSPADVRIDPASNATTLIAYAGPYKGVATGQFTYNALKATFADVLSSVFDTWTTYTNDALQQIETFDPGVDGFTWLFLSDLKNFPVYAGNDEFFGSSMASASDNIRGGPGNDSFTGYGDGQYGDHFHGEGGFDVAFLRGNVSEYTIRATDTWDIIRQDGSFVPGFEVVDTVTGRDGLDYYAGVERLYFSDKVVALDIDGNAGQSYRLYKAALDRVPDGPGLAGWIDYMDQGGQLTAMSQMFIDSPEFIAKYGPLDDAGFVNQLYLNVLDRNADAVGLAGWLDAMANGASRAHVLIGFSESNENQANVIGQIQNGIAYSELV